MNTRQLASVLALALPACTVITGDDPPACTGGKCDGGGVEQTCTDPRYNDGTCNLDLACSVPDIDCFRTYDTDAAAAAWWKVEQTKVGQNFPILDESDPRFAKVRDALDQGWAAFKVHRPVGMLADKRPALVLVDKPMIQNAAFVYGEPEHNAQPFVVMVETPALASNVDATSLLGVMMHELQHAVGLHKLGTNDEKIRKFYVAPTGTDPLGRQQADDANLHQLGEAWQQAASQVGPYSQAELGGLPINGITNQMLLTVVNQALQGHPDICTAPVQALGAAQDAATANPDPLDGSLTSDLSTIAPQISDALAAMRDQCLPNYPYDVIDVGAALSMMTREQFQATLEPRDVDLVAGKHFIDGLTALVEDRRASMRDAEAAFQTASGEPWSQLRYFSVEEDADDVSTIVMRAAHKDPDAMSKFFLAVGLAPDAASACSAKVASGLPGYGVDLTDEHHAVCWRVGHQQRAATEARTLTRPTIDSALPSAVLRAPAEPGLAIAVPVRMPGRIPTAPDPRSRIAD